MSTSNFDFNNVCRTCLSTGNLRPLYEKSAKDSLTIMLETCTALTYNENDGLPIQICTDCVSELKQSYNFAYKCRASEETLRAFSKKLIPQQFETKPLALRDPLAIPEQTVIKNEIDVKSEPLEDPVEREQSNEIITEVKENNQTILKHLNEHEQVVDSNKVNYESQSICSKPDDRRFACAICDSSFRRKQHLKSHLVTHTGERPFSCTLCSRSFGLKTSLNKHIQTHSEAKPYSCQICGISFKHKPNVRTHMRTHTGETPYSCTFCDKAFNRKYSLELHQRTHTGVKPYSCTVCDSVFTQKSSLNLHMKSHTGKKAHLCTLCDCSFKQKHNLIAHIQAHYGEQQLDVQ